MDIKSSKKHKREYLNEKALDFALRTKSVFNKIYEKNILFDAKITDKLISKNFALKPLEGLPISIKDLIDVNDENTLAGSKVLINNAPAKKNADILDLLINSGAIIIGKTNMTEFAFSGVGINPHYGTPGNPFNDKLIPGGSSSGAALSVSNGFCVAGIGTDTGGSIRIPAALCGLVGFKPTMRRVSVNGIIPLSPKLDTIGSITNKVEDCLLIDNIISKNYIKKTITDIRKLKFLLPSTYVLEDLDHDVSEGFSKAISKISSAGIKITEIKTDIFQEARKINLFSPIDAYIWHKDLINKFSDQYDQRVLERIKLGASFTMNEIKELDIERKNWINKVNKLCEGFDCLIMPTVPIIPPSIKDLISSDDFFFKINSLLLRNPSLINLFDGCSLTIPFYPRNGFPVGIMISSKAMKDEHLISIGINLEKILLN